MYLFSREVKILDTTILIFYRKLYINIVPIIVLNIETRQYNIKINLAISCSPNFLEVGDLRSLQLSNEYCANTSERIQAESRLTY